MMHLYLKYFCILIDHEKVATPLIVGMGRAGSKVTDWAVGPVNIYQGVARGDRYTLHGGSALLGWDCDPPRRHPRSHRLTDILNAESLPSQSLCIISL